MSFQVSRSRTDDIKARMRQLERELAELEQFPDDTFAEGTIIRFDLRLPGPGRQHDADVDAVFTYAALKVVNRWWITGRHLQGGHGGVDYDTLRRILTRATNARLFTGDGEPLELTAGDDTAAVSDRSPETHR